MYKDKGKKRISIAMVFVLTIYTLLSVVPAGAVTKAAAKKQISTATALVVKAEKLVKPVSFVVKTAQTSVTTAQTQVKKIGTYGKTYLSSYNSLTKRLSTVTTIIKSQIAIQAKTAAETAVSKAEGLVDTNHDLINNKQNLTNAQKAVQAAITAVTATKASVSDYKGFMARIQVINGIIANAVAASATTSDSSLQVAAETAVKNVELSQLNTVTDISAVKLLVQKANTAIAKVKDADKAAGFTARIKAVTDKADALSLYIPADAAVKAVETAQLNSAADVTTVSALILKADDSISKVMDNASVAKLNDRLNSIKDKVSNITAEAAVSTVEAAPVVNAADLTNIATLVKKAQDSITQVKDAAAVTKFNDRLNVVNDKIALVSADLAVTAVEKAPLVTAQDLTSIITIENTAMDAVSKLKDNDKINSYKTRLKAVDDRATALKTKLDQDALAATTPAKIVAATAAAGTLTITLDKKPLTIPTLSDFKVNVSINGGAQTTVFPTNIAVVNDTTITLSVAAVDAIANLDQALTYSIQYGSNSVMNSSVFTVSKIPVIAVSSVTPLNLKQIKIVFNKAVDKTSAETLSNYSENSVAMMQPYEKAELQADNTSVIITYATPKTQQYTSSLTISNVRSANLLESMTTGVFSLNFMDVTPPTVLSVTNSGNTSINVVFSEPVDGADATTSYKMDGNDLSAFGLSGITYDDTVIPSKRTSVTINFGVRLTSGAHTFTVLGSKIKDSANFYATEASMPLNITQDTTKPDELSSAANGLGTIDITFNKAVILPSLTNVYVNGVPLNATATIGYKSASDKSVVEITKTGLLTPGQNLVTMPKATVTDYYGNTNDTADIRFIVNAVQDTTQPTVIGASATNDKTIVVTYSKPMGQSATNLLNYIIHDSIGNVVGIYGTVTIATGGNAVNINLNTSLPGGNYTVLISGVSDLSGNVITPFTQSVTVKDTTPPAPPTAVLIDPTYKKVKVNFSEPMDVTSITTMSDYQISLYGGTGNPSYVPLDPSVIITPASDYKSVILDFPDNTPLSAGVSTLRTVLVKDAAGNTTAAVADSPIYIAPTTTMTPTFLRATAISQTQLQLEYNGPLTYVDPNDFTYNGTPAQLATLQTTKVLSSDKSTQIDGTIITLTFAGAIIDSAAAGSVYAVAPIGTFDAYMNAISPGLLTSSVADKISPKVQSASKVDANTVDITFTENMQPGVSLLYMKDLSVICGGTNIKIDSSTVIGNKVRLTLDTALTPNQLIYVIPVQIPANIQDMNYNLYVPTQTDLSGILVQ